MFERQRASSRQWILAAGKWLAILRVGWRELRAHSQRGNHRQHKKHQRRPKRRCFADGRKPPAAYCGVEKVYPEFRVRPLPLPSLTAAHSSAGVETILMEIGCAARKLHDKISQGIAPAS